MQVAASAKEIIRASDSRYAW